MQSVALLSFVLLGSFLFLTYSSKAEASPINSNELLPSEDNEGKISVAFLRFLENLQEELEARREIMAAGHEYKRDPAVNTGRGSVSREIRKYLQSTMLDAGARGK